VAQENLKQSRPSSTLMARREFPRIINNLAKIAVVNNDVRIRTASEEQLIDRICSSRIAIASGVLACC
jgi:hypothetical protein